MIDTRKNHSLAMRDREIRQMPLAQDAWTWRDYGLLALIVGIAFAIPIVAAIALVAFNQ